MEHNDVVILQLDKPRILRLGHKALKKFSALTGCQMSSLDKALDRYDWLSQLIYVMLAEEDSFLTQERVDDLLDAVPINEIVEKAAAAVAASFGGGDAAAKEEDPTTAAGTGERA